MPLPHPVHAIYHLLLHRRIVLVTSNVDQGIRDLLWSASWEVHPVDEIRCNQVLGPGVTADKYDIGEEYQRKRAKWLPTCTKFHVRVHKI